MPNPWPGIPYLTATVVANPSLTAETVVASLNIGSLGGPSSLIELSGWASMTISAAGVSMRMRIRRGSLTGTAVADTGTLTGGIVANANVAQDIEGVDQPGEQASAVYVLTVTVGSASGTTTIGTLKLRAVVYN